MRIVSDVALVVGEDEVQRRDSQIRQSLESGVAGRCEVPDAVRVVEIEDRLEILCDLMSRPPQADRARRICRRVVLDEGTVMRHDHYGEADRVFPAHLDRVWLSRLLARLP